MQRAGMHRTTWPALKQLRIYGCGRIKIFGHEESQIQHSLFLVEKIIPQLEHIFLTADDIAMITNGQFAIDLFSHIKALQITEYLNDSAVFPFHFIQRFSNLQKLKMVGCNFKEFSPYEGDVGHYTLKFPSLDDVYVSNCPAMENFCNGALSTPKLQEVNHEDLAWWGADGTNLLVIGLARRLRRELGALYQKARVSTC
ncbi:hypothetical protein J1N35_024038 [Gossypium stocksii]|uniref:Uncharacterized protein n=1 Tax=Gossypium stocksii TaxID=47602 RepID=A0A9D4A496_9ROSI|nr:hypothetical protein J1N35_024038 [Gossypium stocksii]